MVRSDKIFFLATNLDDYTEKNLFPTVKVGFVSVWASFVLSAFFPLFQSMQVNR